MTTALATENPTAYPDEDWDQGLYLDSRTSITTVSTTVRDPALPPNAPAEAVSVHYVSAADFMVVQKERDDLRKAVALINAWRITLDRSEERLVALLARVGQGDTQAEAMLDLVRWAQNERDTTEGA